MATQGVEKPRSSIAQGKRGSIQRKRVGRLLVATTVIFSSAYCLMPDIDCLSPVSFSGTNSCGGLNPASIAYAAPRGNVRHLHFPEKSVGWVYFTVPGEIEDRQSKARGEVVVPAGVGVKLTLSGAATDQGLEFLTRVEPDQITNLCLANLEIGDKHIKYLRNFRRLAKLDVSSTDISDKGLVQLIAMFPSVDNISLARTRITAKSMPVIARGWKSTYKLVLSGVKLGTNSLSPLKKLKALRHLDLDMADVGDVDLIACGKLVNLEELDLSGNPKVTDKGVSYLTNLKAMSRLDLMDTSITGDSAKYVAQMPKLKKLRVREAGLKKKDMARFRAAVKHGKVEDPADEVDMELFEPLHDGYLERHGEPRKGITPNLKGAPKTK